MIRLNRPKNFQKRGSAVSIYVLFEDEILFLCYAQRVGTRKHLTNKWNLPAGKVEKGEKIIDAARRELIEETGIDCKENELKYVRKYYACGQIDRVIYEFAVKLKKKPKILISSEHCDFKWIDRKEIGRIHLAKGRSEIWLHMMKIWDRIGV